MCKRKQIQVIPYARCPFLTLLLLTLLLLLLLLPWCPELFGQEERGELRLMWYNVENLFHPDDEKVANDANDLNDPNDATTDTEFTPEGDRRWTYARYRQKLTVLAKVIVAAGQWKPPEVVGLCEVENAQVLEDLVSHPILAPYGYSYLHRDGPDHRGMDVACLFRQERFNMLEWNFIKPAKGEGFDQTREMLSLCGTWGRRDSLHLVLVHFISRYRGAGETASYRRTQAGRLAGLLDSLSVEFPERLVIAAGDFNDSKDAWSLEPLSELKCLPDDQVSFRADQVNSYKYRGKWSSIDFFLLGGEQENYEILGSVFRLPALLEPDLLYGGEKPKRTYEGYRYRGGYSDHLPVLLDINSKAGLPGFLDFSP